MESHRSADQHAPAPDGLSRRTVLSRLGAGGLAVAMIGRGLTTAQAQEGTPEGTPTVRDTGLPPGVALESLSGVPIRDLPTEPFTLVMYRVTVEPGAVIPNAALPYVSLTYTEKGDFVCPPGGEGRYIYDAEGKVVDSGAGEMKYP